jgi:hypothetical protein
VNIEFLSINHSGIVGCVLSGARRVHPVIVGWSTANRPLMPKPINDNPDDVAARHFYAPNLARHDQPTISGRSCANLGSYKPPFACVIAPFRRVGDARFFLDAGEPAGFCGQL